MKKNIFLLCAMLHGILGSAFGEIVTTHSTDPRILETIENSEEVGVLTPTTKQNSSDSHPVKQQQYTLQQQGSIFIVVPVAGGSYVPANGITSNAQSDEISSSRKTMERNMNKARAYSHSNDSVSGIMGKDGVVIFPCAGNTAVNGKFFITLNGRSTQARCR